MNRANSSQPALAYICHEFPKLTETFVYREIKSLREMGRKVEVFAMKRSSTPEAIEGIDDLLAITRYFPADLSRDFLLAQAKWILKKPIAYFRELYRVIAAGKRRTQLPFSSRAILFLRGAVLASMLERENEFQFMHDPGTGHELVSVHVAHAFLGIPYGFTVHAPLALYLDSPLLACYARDACWIMPTYSDAMERLVKLAGEQVREKCRLVHMGVDVEGYSTANRRQKGKVVGVGTLVERKAHDLTIRAIAILVNRGLDVSLDIMGSGPEHDRLDSLARDLGVADRINFLGSRHPREMRELFTEAEAFVLPCRVDSKGARDGTPIALMEAMAMKLPVISTRVSGIPEIIEDGISGLLVEPEDAEALAEALGRVLEDADFAKALGEAGKERIERHFTLEGEVKGLDELISSRTGSLL